LLSVFSCLCVSSDLQVWIFAVWPWANAENLVLWSHSPDEIVRPRGWIVQKFSWQKYRNFGSLYVYFSNLDKLQNKKIWTAALRHLLIIHYYESIARIVVKRITPQKCKFCLEVHFRHTFKPIDEFKTIMMNMLL
jgi:hypothetical protein